MPPQRNDYQNPGAPVLTKSIREPFSCVRAPELLLDIAASPENDSTEIYLGNSSPAGQDHFPIAGGGLSPEPGNSLMNLGRYFCQIDPRITKMNSERKS